MSLLLVFTGIFFPSTRGTSARSVGRYCKYRNITLLQDEKLEDIVRYFIINYGHT